MMKFPTCSSLTYTITSLPSQFVGQLQLIDGTPVTVDTSYSIDQIRSLQFESYANANGTTDFTINISDGTASIDETIAIGTSFVNDGPINRGSLFSFNSINEDSFQIITKEQLLTGYTDEEGNDLFVNGLSASNGIIEENGVDQWKFTPISHFSGIVELVYVVNDTNGGGILANNSFEVVEVNDKPVRTSGYINTLTVLEDGIRSSMNISSDLAYSTGGASASESAQTLTYTVSSLPVDSNNGESAGTVYKSNGTVVTSGMTLTAKEIKGLEFQPAPDKVGTFYFKFTVSDDGPNADDDDPTTNKNSITESLEILILNFNDTPELPTESISFASNVQG